MAPMGDSSAQVSQQEGSSQPTTPTTQQHQQQQQQTHIQQQHNQAQLHQQQQNQIQQQNQMQQQQNQMHQQQNQIHQQQQNQVQQQSQLQQHSQIQPQNQIQQNQIQQQMQHHQSQLQQQQITQNIPQSQQQQQSQQGAAVVQQNIQSVQLQQQVHIQQSNQQHQQLIHDSQQQNQIQQNVVIRQGNASQSDGSGQVTPQTVILSGSISQNQSHLQNTQLQHVALQQQQPGITIQQPQMIQMAMDGSGIATAMQAPIGSASNGVSMQANGPNTISTVGITQQQAMQAQAGQNQQPTIHQLWDPSRLQVIQQPQQYVYTANGQQLVMQGNLGNLSFGNVNGQFQVIKPIQSPLGQHMAFQQGKQVITQGQTVFHPQYTGNGQNLILVNQNLLPANSISGNNKQQLACGQNRAVIQQWIPNQMWAQQPGAVVNQNQILQIQRSMQDSSGQGPQQQQAMYIQNAQSQQMPTHHAGIVQSQGNQNIQGIAQVTTAAGTTVKTQPKVNLASRTLPTIRPGSSVSTQTAGVQNIQMLQQKNMPKNIRHKTITRPVMTNQQQKNDANQMKIQSPQQLNRMIVSTGLSSANIQYQSATDGTNKIQMQQQQSSQQPQTIKVIHQQQQQNQQQSQHVTQHQLITQQINMQQQQQMPIQQINSNYQQNGNLTMQMMQKTQSPMQSSLMTINQHAIGAIQTGPANVIERPVAPVSSMPTEQNILQPVPQTVTVIKAETSPVMTQPLTQTVAPLAKELPALPNENVECKLEARDPSVEMSVSNTTANNVSVEENICPSEDQSKEKSLPRALVKPQPIITHFIDGHIIHESDQPFPVYRSVLMSDLSKLEEQQAEEPSPKKIKTEEGMSLKCEFCGKTDSMTQVVKKQDKIFCSLNCSKRSALGYSKLWKTLPQPDYEKIDPNGIKKEESENATGTDQASSTSNAATEKVDITRWTIGEVCDFIRTMPEYGPFVNKFYEQEIDGRALTLLEVGHLVSLMDMKLGGAIKLLDMVKSMKAADT